MEEVVSSPRPPNSSAKSRPTDLKVTFDDGTSCGAHALLLELASPVFAELLHDKETGELVSELALPGKTKAEFELFSMALQPASMRMGTLSDESTYLVLVRWAHEYEVENLREVCEDHLIHGVAVDEASLGFAIEYSLQRRLVQVLTVMKEDLSRYVETLGQLATEKMRPQLEEMWPHLCVAAGIREYTLPPTEHVASMWPFIVAAVRSKGPVLSHLKDEIIVKGEKQLEELTKELRAKSAEVALEIKATTTTYGNYLYERFWQQANYMQDQVKGYLQ